MKTYKFDDLKEIGINPLTGEACIYGQRLLCDLNEDGAKLVQRFFSLPPADPADAFGLAKNWNSMVGAKPAVASIMLTRETLRGLLRFHIFAVEQADAYVECDYQIVSLMQTDEYFHSYEELGNGHKFVRNYAKASTHPRVGDRNVHAATGRTE